MKHQAKILADSVSPHGVRLTTFELTYPRIIHAEFMTHRVVSRNAASSRAIPVKKMIRMVEETPYIPSHWGKNKRGMQAGDELTEAEKQRARSTWLHARDQAVEHARELLDIGLHKQLTNRLLEPFQWYTIIATATEWSNFFNLRANEMAHPDIRIVAEKMKEEYERIDPVELDYGEWHLPLLDETDFELLRALAGADDGPAYFDVAKKVSCARCARVSYLTHDGKRDLQKDLELYDRLVGPGHFSPLEHAARPMREDEVDNWLGDNYPRHPGNTWCGNLKGWVQHRKEIPGEEDILGYRKKS